MTKPPQTIFSLIPLHYSSLHLRKFPCHFFQTRFYCSHSPILSQHMVLNNSFSAQTHNWYALLHTSTLAREYCSLITTHNQHFTFTGVLKNEGNFLLLCCVRAGTTLRFHEPWRIPVKVTGVTAVPSS